MENWIKFNFFMFGAYSTALFTSTIMVINGMIKFQWIVVLLFGVLMNAVSYRLNLKSKRGVKK